MNEDLMKFQKHDISRIGLDLYFYSFRTLAIFQYEILYQLSEGAWNYSRYPQGHSQVWMEANLHLTQGKTNVRCIVEPGCKILKNDYNLKKILNMSTSYRRIEAIGRLINCCSDEDYAIKLLNAGFHEHYDKLSEWDMTEEGYQEMIMNLNNDPETRELSELLTPELMECYYSVIYNQDEMRDDLGMIQNTMRTTSSFQY